jgi:hypothetical protein
MYQGLPTPEGSRYRIRLSVGHTIDRFRIQRFDISNAAPLMVMPHALFSAGFAPLTNHFSLFTYHEKVAP